MMLRADWFVFACAQPPLYEEIIYRARIPTMFTARDGGDMLLEK